MYLLKDMDISSIILVFFKRCRKNIWVMYFLKEMVLRLVRKFVIILGVVKEVRDMLMKERLFSRKYMGE